MTTYTTHRDLSLELYDSLDGSGDYLTDWIDRECDDAVRLLIGFNSGTGYTVTFEEGMYDGHPTDRFTIRREEVVITNLLGAAEFKLTAGYYRVRVSSSNDGPTLHIVIRRI